MRQRRSLTSLCLLGVLLAAAGPVVAVNEGRLWLPRAHLQLQPYLLAAAKLAEQSPECVEVISGELDLSRSTETAPVFRVVCRNEAGFTYGVRVMNAGAPDATLEKVQGRGVPAKSPLSPRANKKDDGTPAAARADAADEESVLRRCEDALRRRTSGMTGVGIDMSTSQRTTTPDGATHYDIDFDARDPSGEPLLFRAVCHVGPNDAVRLELSPRRQIRNTLSSEPAAPGDAPAMSASEGDSTRAEKGEAPAIPPAPVNETAPAPDDDGWEVVE